METLASFAMGALLGAGARLWWDYRYNRQIPLSEYTCEDFHLAFRFAPERRAEIVNRGSMSRNEFFELQKLNMERIDAELRRRGERP